MFKFMGQKIIKILGLFFCLSGPKGHKYFLLTCTLIDLVEMMMMIICNKLYQRDNP